MTASRRDGWLARFAAGWRAANGATPAGATTTPAPAPADDASDDAARAARDARTEEFLGVLGHELRNPLAPLRTALQLLRMPGVPPDRAAELLDVADRQIVEMVRLIDTLSDYSRASRGRIELYRESLDLAAVLDDAVVQSRLDRERHRQTIAVEIVPGEYPVSADAARLAQVIGQLLGNAARFSADGGHIAVSLRRDGDDGVVTVRDEGVGIAPARVRDVFEPFERTHPPEGRSPGLGLGLTIARHVAGQHGGTLAAASDGEGRGSAFELRVPLRAAG